MINFNYLTLSLLIFVFISTCIFIYALIMLKKKTNKKKQILMIVCALTIVNVNVSFLTPYHKLLKFKSVENAFYFRNPQGRILFQKEIKNTTFVYGTYKYKSEKEHSYPGSFSLYVKNDGSWQTKHSKEDNFKNHICIYEKNNGRRYDIYKFYNKEDNVTGIYVTNDLPNSPLSTNSKITDSYSTKFESIEAVSDELFETYIFFGVLTNKIDENYYIDIDGKKYILSEYSPLC